MVSSRVGKDSPPQPSRGRQETDLFHGTGWRVEPSQGIWPVSGGWGGGHPVCTHVDVREGSCLVGGSAEESL